MPTMESPEHTNHREHLPQSHEECGRVSSVRNSKGSRLWKNHPGDCGCRDAAGIESKTSVVGNQLCPKVLQRPQYWPRACSIYWAYIRVYGARSL